MTAFDPSTTETGPAATLPRPRVRIGAVLWGLVLVAAAATTLWVCTVPSRREATLEAIVALDGFGWSVVAVVTLGGILTLVALAAVVRSLQRRRP